MKKKLLTYSVLLILIFSLSIPALASGDGTGGGSNDPLMLASSSVQNGAEGIATDVVITLTFNKNVVNMTVRDNNMTCFTLTQSGGSSVPIAVLMGDDQVDPTIKRIVNIKPDAPLSSGTSYTLTISGSLTSKSGAALGSDVTLTFKTAEAPLPAPSETPAPPSPSAAPEASPSDAAVPSSTAAPSTEAVPPSSSPTPLPSADPAPAEQSPAVTAEQTGQATPGEAVTPSPIQPEDAPDTNAQPDAEDAVPPSEQENSGPQILPFILAGAGLIVIAGIIVVILRRKK